MPGDKKKSMNRLEELHSEIATFRAMNVQEALGQIGAWKTSVISNLNEAFGDGSPYTTAIYKLSFIVRPSPIRVASGASSVSASEQAETLRSHLEEAEGILSRAVSDLKSATSAMNATNPATRERRARVPASSSKSLLSRLVSLGLPILLAGISGTFLGANWWRPAAYRIKYKCPANTKLTIAWGRPDGDLEANAFAFQRDEQGVLTVPKRPSDGKRVCFKHEGSQPCAISIDYRPPQAVFGLLGLGWENKDQSLTSTAAPPYLHGKACSSVLDDISSGTGNE